jgi:predicted HAD superfamily Cof-like phosphohydrolase
MSDNTLDFVGKVKLFNEIAGQKEEFNKRKASLYVGLILEELAEMFESFQLDEWNRQAHHLHALGNSFKCGDYDYVMDNVDRVGYLDASVDIAVVSLGASISIGADVEKACNKVADNNLSKFPVVDGKHTVMRDANGKIAKPEGFTSVDLSDCIR